jgi:hypothetical protein
MTLSATPAPARSSAEEVRALEVIKQARAAIGGEEKLRSVSGLSLAWKFRRLTRQGGQETGETRYDFIFPDKFRKEEILNMGGDDITEVNSSSLLNGELARFDVRSSNPGVPVMDNGPGGGDAQARLRQGLRKEYALQALQLLLTPSPSYPFEFTYAGEAQAGDGSADVLDAKGPGGFAVRLFFDKTTHRLLMMSYKEPRPVFMPGQQAKGATRSDSGENTEDMLEVRLRFSDYRAEAGILLPHLITREKDGKIDRETELKSVKINPSFKPEYFAVKG